MRKRLTPEQKKQYVVKQTLTPQQIDRLESYPEARKLSPSELEALRLASINRKPEVVD